MHLLLQSRDDMSQLHEYKCLYELGNAAGSEFIGVNLHSPTTTVESVLAKAREAEGILIGCSAELSYNSTSKGRVRLDAIRSKLLPVLRQVIAAYPEKKILGICFGHQILAESLGGTVLYAPAQKEVGAVKVHVTADGAADPLFDGVSHTFTAITGHQDAVTVLPLNATLLATSARCSMQAFRYGRAIYGVQFHPEADYDGFL